MSLGAEFLLSTGPVLLPQIWVAYTHFRLR
jgi:hypothetical protein